MRILYVLNYQREIPPFAQMEVLYANKYFDRIVYITRKLINDNSQSIKFSNVEVIQISRVVRCRAFLRLLSMCFSKTVLTQIYKAIKDHVFSLSYLKALMVELYVSEQLYSTCRNHARAIKSGEKYVVSCWFNGVALAAAKLQKDSQYKSYSFAHAFEVDPDRNPFLGYLLEEYKHRYLLKISFIAEAMLKKYSNAVYSIIGVQKNAVVEYLGTTKMYVDKKAMPSNEFTICSCSTVNEIKRLYLLVDALSNIKELPIRWIHIGDGPEFDNIRFKAKSIINNNLEFSFLGKLANERVQEFYSKHYIDLFINVSRSEGLPISIMEAMSYSIPCMATDVGGTKEIVNNINGILLKEDISSTELAAEIINFINEDDELKIQKRLSSFNDWDSRFNADKNINQYYSRMISVVHE